VGLLDLLFGKPATPAKVTKTTATAADKAKAAAAASLAPGTSLKTASSTPAKATTSAPVKTKTVVPATGGKTTSTKTKTKTVVPATGGKTTTSQSQTSAPAPATIIVGGQAVAVPEQFQPLVSTIPAVGSFGGLSYQVVASAPSASVEGAKTTTPAPEPVASTPAPASGAPVIASVNGQFFTVPDKFADLAQQLLGSGLSEGSFGGVDYTVNVPTASSIDPSTGQYVNEYGALSKRDPAMSGIDVATGHATGNEPSLASRIEEAYNAVYGAGALATVTAELLAGGVLTPPAASLPSVPSTPSTTPTTPAVPTVPTVPGTTPAPSTVPTTTPTTPSSNETVPPSISGGDSPLSQLFSPKRLLIFGAIGLLTGIWLIGN